MSWPVPASSSPPGYCAVADEHCITCSDEGTPMRVLALGPDGLACCVDDAGSRSEVEVALVGAVVTGDRLLVHAGTAIARVEGEAV